MIAVIDIGTNTFHLLIAKIVDEENYQIVFRESIFVRIAKDGIDPISPKSLERAINTLSHFVKTMESYEITHLRVVGTEALRSASNGHELIELAKNQLGLSIEIITGEEEARLIFEGTAHAIPAYKSPYLIMDIGGGSVEFILANSGKIIWWGSYKIGVQYLFLQYHKDPFPVESVDTLKIELNTILADLKQQIEKHKPTRLVGSSGSFETLASLAELSNDENYVVIPTNHFDEIFKNIVSSSHNDRLENPSIPDDRAELIVIGFLLVEHILSLFNAEEIIVSAYALREGLLYSNEKYGRINTAHSKLT